jgi:WD40 repeat protein
VRLSGALAGVGAALLVAGVLLTPGVAGATFTGTNGNLVWSNDCGNGQALWTASYTSTGLTCPYTAVTAGAADSMPYFDAAGNLVYFASTRNGNSAIWSVPYPNTVTGSADSATQITNLTDTGDDYAPTVDAADDLLAYIHCTSASTGCSLTTMALPAGTVTQVTTAVAISPYSASDGTENRPEIDPANPALILYVDNAGHIHEMTLSSAASAGGTDATDAASDVDLSANSGVGTNQDEHPDWAPDGQALVFDSSRGGLPCQSGVGTQPGNTTFTMTNLTAPHPTVALVWKSSPCNGTSQIEPVYAPTPGADVSSFPVGGSPTVPLLSWITVKAGANVSVDDGSLAHDDPVTNVTQTHNNNIQVIWQPVPQTGPILPETPYAVLLPGGALLMIGLGLGLRRRMAVRAST